LTTVVVKSIDEIAVRRATDAWAAEVLARHPDVEEIVVFGSFAEGTWAPGSDLDVLIRLRASDRPVRDRVQDLLPAAFPVPVDVFPYTGAEIAERADSPILAAVKRSRWRYARPADAQA
jgi:predicted nucleotidyltransferase